MLVLKCAFLQINDYDVQNDNDFFCKAYNFSNGRK